MKNFMKGEDMLHVKLEQIESSHNNVRTKEMEGKCTHIPEVGYGFIIFGKSLTPGLPFRRISTSEIQECSYVEKDRKFLFQTLNSKYELTVLDDRDPKEYARVQN